MDWQVLSSASSSLTNAMRTDESTDLSTEVLKSPTFQPPKNHLATYTTLASSPISSFLSSLYPTTELCSLTGHLPHLNLIYTTIDSSLYLSPPNSTDFISYTGLTQIITNVSEAKPQEGVFQDVVKETIIVTTPTEIHVLAVTNNPTTLVPTTIILPTTHPITTVCSSRVTNRILVGDTEGDVFEVVYTDKADEKGLIGGVKGIIGKVLLGDDRKKARKINHTSTEWVPEIVRSIKNKMSGRGNVKEIKIDDERGLAWGIWKDGTVECWDLKDGNKLSGYGGTLRSVSYINVPTLMKTYMTLLARSSTYSSNYQIHIHSGSLPAVGGSAGARNILKQLHSTTYNKIQIVPNSRSVNIQALVTSSNGMKVFLTATNTSCKISHVGVPLDADYKPSNVAASNLYSKGGSDEIHFEGNLKEGVEVYQIGEGDVVVDSNNNTGSAPPGSGSGNPASRNYVYCYSTSNNYAVSPIDGDICDVVELPRDSYIDALIHRSKTPNDSTISKISQPVKVTQPLKLVYQQEAKQDDEFFYGGAWCTLKYVTGGTAMVVSRGGCRKIALDNRKTVVGRCVDNNNFKELLKSASKTNDMSDIYAELFAIACESHDPRKVISVMFENTNGPQVVDGQMQFSWVAEGAWKFVSRCLRSVWFKSVAHVKPEKKKGKDGKPIPGGTVKVIISGSDLDRVRAPLHALQNLLKTFFLPAVSTAPSSFTTTSKSSTATVPVPTTSDGVLTRTMVFYNAANSNHSDNDDGTETTQTTTDGNAKTQEEQSIHSLYRLVSRSVQCLSLIDLLCYAHELDGVPPVEWGSLSSVSFKQWVCDKEIHERIKKVLAGITSFTRDGNNNPNSFEADKLASALSSQCYLYFSSGDRLSYEGFKLCSSSSVASVARAGSLLRKAARFWTSPSSVCETGGSFDRACDALFDVRAISGIVDVVIATASNFGGTVKGSNCEDDEVAGTNMNQLFDWEHGIYSNGGGDGTAEEARKKCYDVLLQKLHRLIELKEFDAADEMMSNAICSEDNVLHEVLYDNLLKTKQIERLIRIQSPRLEKFLNDVDKSLLWRFYVFHGRHSDACVLMSTTGLSKEKISLDERIACFTRAVNSAVAMSGGGVGVGIEGGDDSGFQLAQLKEYLEVATLQRLILSAISQQVKDGLCDEAVEEDITYRLLDVSEMYNDVCGPFCLWELCLSILLVCGMSDHDNIRLLWKAIIVDEIPADSKNEAILAHLLDMRQDVPIRGGVVQGQFEDGDWIVRVKSKVINVARGLWGRGADYIVPVELLIFELEGLRRCWDLVGGGGEKGNWVISAFAEAGIEWSKLADCYCQVLSEREGKGADKSERVHYLMGIVEVLMRWGKDGGFRRVGNVRSIIDNVKSNLETLVGGGNEVNNLVQSVRLVESMLGGR